MSAVATLKHNLPAEPNRFIGRQHDLEELSRVFAQTRALTLAGVGGIGKTRFALRLASRLVEEHPGGVWLVELAALGEPGLIAQEIADALGVREEPDRPILATLRDFLSGRRLLLVLDNCEHLIEACADLVRQLLAACPELKVIATSREPLKIPGELLWRVPPLDLPEPGRPAEQAEAVQLFMDRAVAAGSGLHLTDRNTEAVVRLCRALDGVPLALELAAARTAVLSPEQITQRIDDRFRLLTGSDRSLPARQRTLLATVEWSYDLLSPAERLLLRRLSVFAGPFDLDLAESVCGFGGLQVEQVLDLIGSLVDKSLVLCDQGGGAAQYRLLETTRQFGQTLLVRTAERDELRDRHLEVMAAGGERQVALLTTEPGAPLVEAEEVYWWFIRLRPDFRAAMAWAIETRQAEIGLRAACAAYHVWNVAGALAEMSRWMDRLLSVADEAAPETTGPEAVPLADPGVAPGLSPEVRGFALCLQADLRSDLGDAQASERLAVEGLELLRRGEPGFPLRISLALAGEGWLRRGDLARARELAQESATLAGEARDFWSEGFASGVLAIAALFEGRVREAQRQAERTLASFEASRNGYGVAMGLQGLAYLAEERGDLRTALAYMDRSVPLLERFQAKSMMSVSLAAMAGYLCHLGEPGQAAARARQSLELSRATGNQSSIRLGLAALATVAEHSGDLEGAVRIWAATVELEERAGLSSSQAKAESLLARARAGLGEARVSVVWELGRTMGVEEAAAYDGGHTAPVPVREPLPGGGGVLSAREREIAALLVKGLSNKAVAAELVISPATVARHVANILQKLGFTSRTQIAAWAASEGIT